MAKKKDIKVKDKDIQIDYYQIWLEERDDTGALARSGIYDIEPILNKLLTINVKDRIQDYKDEISRIQVLRQSTINTNYTNLKECKDIWEIEFLRIRKNKLPGVAADDGSFDPTYLNSLIAGDKGICESVSALYDSKLCVLAIQRNKDGLPPSAILEFFQATAVNKNVMFKPIILDKELGKIKEEAIFRGIEIGFAELRRDTVVDTNIKSILNILGLAKEFETINLRIKMSLGNVSKKKSLNQHDIVVLAKELSTHANVNTLLVNVKANPDASVEKVDLIQNRLKDSFNVAYSKENPILHDNVYTEISYAYNNRRPILLSKLKKD